MARFKIVTNDVITNIIEAEADFAASIGATEAEDDHAIGMVWDGITFAPPSPPPPTIPALVTRRQILTGLAQVGWITEDEAEAALSTGARPVAVDAVISALPAEEQFPARMKWIGFRDALRNDEMVAALAAVEGKTEQDIDAFFVLCAGVE